MQGLWNWLITDAGAGWILGLIGLAGALYTWRKRERPTQVVVREIETIRLLDIHPSQHESFTILYPNAQGTQTSITNLRQTSIIVYNTGTRDITEPIQLTFKLHEKDVKEGARGFWKLVVDTPEYTFQPIHGDTTDITKALRLDLPYLNSYDTHKQIIKMYFMSELKITLELVNTNSKGW